MNFTQVISFLGISITGSESGSDITAYIRGEGASIRWTRGLDQIRQLAPAMIGTEQFRLNNESQIFSPGNTLSSLYNKLKPGKHTRLYTDSAAGESFAFMDGSDFTFMDGSAFLSFSSGPLDVFTGVTEMFSHNPEIGEVSVDVNILDMLSRLGDKEISTAFYESITIDEAITVVLDAVNWPLADRLLDVATRTMDSWSLNKANAFEAIKQLVLTEGINACFYCDGSGNFVFKNNDALLTETVSTVSQATFSDQVNMLVEKYDDRAQDIILAVQVTQQEREAQALDVIWTHEGDLVLDPNEEVTLIISNSEPFKNAVEPSLAGINAEQLLMPSVPLTSGTFIANVNGTDTAAINWNDSLSTIQAAFDTAVGAGKTVLTGSLVNGLRVQFIGDLAAQAIPLITIKSSLNTGTAPASINIQDATDGSNQKYIIFPSAPLSAGSFKISSVNGNTTLSIPYNSADSFIQTRVEALALISPGDVLVTGGDIDTDTLTIEYTGSLALQFVPTSIVEQSSLRTATASTATLIVTETVKGGGPDVVVSAGDATFEFPVRTSGADVPLVVTAGASGATLMNLKVRAQIMKVVRTRVVTYPEGASLPDGQIYKPTIRQEIPLIDAQAFVMTLYDRYSVSRPTESVVIFTPLADVSIYTVLQYQIGYRVSVVGTQNGINGDFYIRQMEHILDCNSTTLLSSYGLEAA